MAAQITYSSVIHDSIHGEQSRCLSCMLCVCEFIYMYSGYIVTID